MTEQTIQTMIEGVDVTPRVGMQVVPDQWSYAKPMTGCEWDAADFRIWDGREHFPALAAKVEVTGRSIRRTGSLHRPHVRVRITFVGDGEPDQVTGGVMFLDGKS